ncbi:DUF2891 domain-containing protein [Alteromonas macleodii]|jgi:hypothetical protein|uniref:DUF2891 domain-containing protein n=1 Tax=Alteromonas macleodii TaxID=28108 RepID=A0A1E7DGV3_ALTMA|nr:MULTISPECIES: DUF2891 domain-containing protein [Alteromonas]AMN11132.1 hypothetical protein ACZ81_05735 [Alteromonas macleodii]OES34099.1 hypothetical protein BFV95_1178 [Alteromonas macleodii]OES34912.1 hypothetical protein BFV94_1178 [Alteromonas macleodii]OES36109.1 hypothetical protein BFV93_1178 [Alteromonas macleodii]OES42048.1 hypothetical protein BFV96_1177 [Alteromonas macleodii]|tara:strand:+ start:709 stop:1965 length:1257 start_codon:yes stop_codon:yes gene_type:complete
MYRAALYSKRLSLYIGDILLIDKARKIMIKIKNVVSCTVAFATAFAAHTAFATSTSTVEIANTSNTSINQTADATANADVPNNNYESVFANLALHCIHQEFPNVVKHMMNNGDDVKAPNQLYPSFYGCLDWHSSVHGHWLLVRMLNTAQDAVDKDEIIEKLNISFTPKNIQGELTSLKRENNASFERPYGLAWFLQLTAELRQSSLPEATKWLNTLRPLEDEIVARVSAWLPKLAYPIRTGEHSQTAFAFGLMLDWAKTAGNKEFEALLTSRVKDYYQDDTQCPLAYEPSGQDFLSPCLAEADLMRRVMSKKDYSQWLSAFFPSLTARTSNWLAPATVTDKTDGKLAHLDGLNISRAWMIEGIMQALPEGDKRLPVLKKALSSHREAGLNAVFGDMHYMGSHWLGSFASYLETQRGLN